MRRWRSTKNAGDNRSARRLLEGSALIDPRFTAAMALLGLTLWWDARYDASVDKQHFLRLAERQAEKIIDIDPDMAAAAYMLKGAVALLRDQHDEAVRHCEIAVDLAPNDFHNLGVLGIVYRFAGQSDKAVAVLKTAMRLNPHVPAWCWYHLATANLWQGNFALAQEIAQTYLQQEPDDPYGYMNLATIYGFQEQEAEASASVALLRERFPAFGIRNVVLAEPYKERDKLDRVIEVLRRAGLPD